jgi:hypothetical protein
MEKCEACICISRNRVKSLLNFNQWLSIKPTKV